MRTVLTILALIIFSCNNGENKVNSENKVAREDSIKPDATETENFAGCYIRILERDTMVLHLQQSGINVSGKMNFDNFQKDGSSGNVKGVIEKDLVKLWYNFQSEGMNSVMELYFKQTGSSLIQAVGPMDTKADTAYFSDYSQINYPNDQSFSKTDCSTVSRKYLL